MSVRLFNGPIKMRREANEDFKRSIELVWNSFGISGCCIIYNYFSVSANKRKWIFNGEYSA